MKVICLNQRRKFAGGVAVILVTTGAGQWIVGDAQKIAGKTEAVKAQTPILFSPPVTNPDGSFYHATWSYNPRP